MCDRISLPKNKFRDVNECRMRAERWCAEVAGMRVHGTTQLRRAEVFAADEQASRRHWPDEVFDIPTCFDPEVAPDRLVQVAKGAEFEVTYEYNGKCIANVRMTNTSFAPPSF